MTMSDTDAPTLTPDEFSFLQSLLKRKAGIEIAERQSYLIDARLPPVVRAYGLDGPPAVIAALRRGTDADSRAGGCSAARAALEPLRASVEMSVCSMSITVRRPCARHSHALT